MTASHNAGQIDLAGLAQSPALYPQKLDLAAGRALLIRMSEADYRASSFLDDRILTPQTQGAWVALDDLRAAAMEIAPCPLHFIFHIGHVGSTLVSRLLSETGDVLPLREPVPLRQLAELFDRPGGKSQGGDILEVFLRLWSRGFASTSAVILKATSATARLTPALLAARPEARAIYLTLGAEAHIATLLAGQNSAAEMNGMGPERLQRLRNLTGASDNPQPRSLEELAAMSWLSERLTQQAVLMEYPARVLPVDFEEFLQHTEEVLSQVLRHYGLDASGEKIEVMLNSALWRSYSKSPSETYSPGLRNQMLAETRKLYGAEIARALKWLDDLAHRDGNVAAVLRG